MIVKVLNLSKFVVGPTWIVNAISGAAVATNLNVTPSDNTNSEGCTQVAEDEPTRCHGNTYPCIRNGKKTCDCPVPFFVPDLEDMNREFYDARLERQSEGQVL